jgi:WD40 repeat protein
MNPDRPARGGHLDWNACFSRLSFLLLLAGQTIFPQDLLKTVAPAKVFEGSEAIQKISVSDDGGSGLILHQDGSIRAVDFLTQRSIGIWEPGRGAVTAMALSRSEGQAPRLITVATERALWSTTADRANAFQKVWETKASIYGVSVSPAQDLAAVATSDGFFILNPRTGATVFSNTEAGCPVARFAPDGRTLAVGMGKKVLIYRVPSFTQKQSWSMNFSPHTLAYSSNALFIAIGGDRDTILIKEAVDGKTVKTLKLDASAQDGSVLSFASDSTGLFASTDFRLVSFTGLDRERPTAKTFKLKDRILSMGFSRAAESLFVVTEGSRFVNQWGVAVPKAAQGVAPGPNRFNFIAVPPKITLISPTTGTRIKDGAVQVTFKVSSPGGQPVSKVRILVAGRPARITAIPLPAALPAAEAGSSPSPILEGTIPGPFLSDQEYTYQVSCADRDATFLVQAESSDSTSEPAVVKVQRSEAMQAQSKFISNVVPPVLTLEMTPHQGETAANAASPNPLVDLQVVVHHAPDQPVLHVKVLVDGNPVSISGVLNSDGTPFNPSVGYINGENYRFPVRLPRRDSTVMVVAETAFAESEPVVTKLGWKSHIASVPSSSPAAARVSEPAAKDAPAPGTNFPPGEGEGLKSDEAPLTRKAEGTLDSSATRILGGTQQDSSVPLQVDAKGRLRWQSPKSEGKAKPTMRQPVEIAPVTVQILAPANLAVIKDKEALISVKVGFTPGHEISKLQLLVDGVPVEAMPTTSAGAVLNAPPANGQVVKFRLALPPQDCQVTVLAEGAASHSKPATIKILRGGKTASVGSAKAAGPLGAAAKLAKPLVNITDPPQDSVVRGNTVRVGVRVSTQPGQAAPTVRILVDAQDVRADRAPPKQGEPAPLSSTADRGGQEEIQYFTIAIPSKDCTVMAYAETPYATSDPALLKLRWDRSGMSTPSTGLPTLYLLAVGVSKYKDKSYSLIYPAKDARDFGDAMKAQKGKLYKDVVMKIRTDESATRDNIMDDLEWIQRQATQQDMVVVFFAGHGINDTVTGNYYFLPHDSNMEAVKRTMIPGSEIHSTLARLTGTRLLFMDTCHAGNITGTVSRGVPDMRQFLQDLKDGGQGLVVITSSRPGQKSQEHPSWKNGAFTKALVEGLKGKAQRDKQGFVTFTALDAYITQRVKELTNGTQAPTTQKGTEVSDFPVALVD